MIEEKVELREVHWLMDLFHSIEVGLMVIDRDYRLRMWNGFMQNHTNLLTKAVIGQLLWEIFPEVAESWFKRKVDSVVQLRAPAYTTWEQRPHLLRLQSFRPVTGRASTMYQNTTFMPLVSADGAVEHVGILIYDVTSMAVNRVDLESVNDKLAALSRTDRLTGLFNRGYWEERLEAEFRRCRRSGGPGSLVLLDIDHFKRINDTYGHPFGDDVIRRIAEVIGREARTTDIAGRYGGEEFAIILVDTPADSAVIMAERLRRKVASQEFQGNGSPVSVTISLGIAAMDKEYANYSAWVECADQALYRAKTNGRNRTEVFGVRTAMVV